MMLTLSGGGVPLRGIWLSRLCLTPRIELKEEEKTIKRRKNVGNLKRYSLGSATIRQLGATIRQLTTTIRQPSRQNP